MTQITSDDVVTVIDIFMAAWPWAEWNEKTMAIWIDGLGTPILHGTNGQPDVYLDGAIALLVARRCVRRWERPGSLAEYLAEYRSEAERRKPSGRPELEAPTHPDTARRMLAAAREALTAPKKQHDHHGGWRNCPVCKQAVEAEQARLAAGDPYIRTKYAENRSTWDTR